LLDVVLPFVPAVMIFVLETLGGYILVLIPSMPVVWYQVCKLLLSDFNEIGGS
jgi:hypothetical protein